MDGRRSSDDMAIAIAAEEDIIVARQAVREIGARAGCSRTQLTEVATALSEIARNILHYADGGEVRLRIVESEDSRGVEVTAADRGPGIADVQRALQDGYTTGDGLGLGLPGARRLVDTFSIVSAVGEGTTVVMCKWGTRPAAPWVGDGWVA